MAIIYLAVISAESLMQLNHAKVLQSGKTN